MWAAARSDSQRAYVLDKSSGNISVIDPTMTPDVVVGAVADCSRRGFHDLRRQAQPLVCAQFGWKQTLGF